MNAVTRCKTIATIAVAFSAGNLFATACQNAGSGKANAEDGTTEGSTEDGGSEEEATTDADDETPPPAADGAGRAVVEVYRPVEGTERCWNSDREAGSWYDPAVCPCPSGFSVAGLNSDQEVICLED